MFRLTPAHRRRDYLAGRGFWDFGSIFDEFFNDSFFRAFMPSTHPIRADIRETEKEYIIEAEIPGVKKEDINIELRDDILTISVERKEQINEERSDFIRRERRYGSYSRSFYVDNVKHEGAKATYNNGVLTLTLPKSDSGGRKGHTIEIQ